MSKGRERACSRAHKSALSVAGRRCWSRFMVGRQPSNAMRCSAAGDTSCAHLAARRSKMPQRCRTKLLQSLRPIPLNSPPMENNFRTPIVLIAFNRPRQTAEVVRTIRAQRPARLFIIADGPRPGVETDPEKCAAVRGLVEKIDWPCQVERRFAETNLGLRRNVAEGLDWVFQQTERAIIDRKSVV